MNTMGFTETSIYESKASKVLMGEYSQREIAPLSMIRTPKVDDSIMSQARMLHTLKEGQTPLLVNCLLIKIFKKLKGWTIECKGSTKLSGIQKN